jgi:polysaccharide biosynthesis protein PslE
MISNSGTNGNGNGFKGIHQTPLSPRDVGSARRLLSETSLRDFYRILFRHKGKVFCFAVATMLAAAGFAFLYPKSYQSEAKLFLKLGRENVGLDATTNLGQSATVSIPPSREEEINTAVEVLRSRLLIEEVVDAVGPSAVLKKPDPPGGEKGKPSSPLGQIWDVVDGASGWVLRFVPLSPLSEREQAVLKLNKRIGVEAVKRTNVIAVSCEAPSPEFAQTLLTKFIAFYVDRHAQINRAAGAHQFLQEQAASLKGDLTTLEDKLRVLKNTSGLAAPLEQRQTIVAQIGRLEDEEKLTRALVAATEAETLAIQTRIAGLSEVQTLSSSYDNPNAAADGMRQQLFALQLKERELSARTTERNVELKLVREQVAASQKLVAAFDKTRSQYTTGPNRNSEELRLQLLRQESALAASRAKASVLDTQLAAAKKQLRTQTDSELQIAQLQREIEIRDANYRKYANALEQARIDDSLERERISNVFVVQPPTLSGKPVRPPQLFALLAGVGIALFGGVVLAYVAEYLDHSLKTPQEVEFRLGLPVLVSIPRVRTQKPRRSLAQG